MVYVCGNDRDYNHWKELGNDEWGYDDILPFQKRSEHNTDPSIAADTNHHSDKGLLYVSTMPNKNTLIPQLHEGWKQLGYRSLKDYNAQFYNGMVNLQATVYKNERMTAWRAFLAPFWRERPNLKVFMQSQVSEVIFEDVGGVKRAVGVQVITDNPKCPVIPIMANNEVILSGGTFGTTKIMLQSGIGRRTDLDPHGITQIADLNVGYNLQDHAYAMVWFEVNGKTAKTQTLLGIMLDTLKYVFARKGQFSEIGSLCADSFINITDPDAKYPDCQYAYFHLEKNQQFIEELLSNFNLKTEYIAQISKVSKRAQVVSVEVVVINPKSRGRYELRGKDPRLHPKITSNYYTDEEGYDLDTTKKGIHKLIELLNTDVMKEAGARLIDFGICKEFEFFSDDYIECYVTYFSANLWHPSGTCKMGPDKDKDSVVDQHLRVKKVTNLRACTACIFPTIPSGNTQCPCYMVGERCADFILKQWKP